jgi:hypothetical protein
MSLLNQLNNGDPESANKCRLCSSTERKYNGLRMKIENKLSILKTNDLS